MDDLHVGRSGRAGDEGHSEANKRDGRPFLHELTHGVWAINSAQVALNHSTHFAISGEEVAQLCSYSTHTAPLNFWRCSSASMPLALLTPVAHVRAGTEQRAAALHGGGDRIGIPIETLGPGMIVDSDLDVVFLGEFFHHIHHLPMSFCCFSQSMA